MVYLLFYNIICNFNFYFYNLELPDSASFCFDNPTNLDDLEKDPDIPRGKNMPFYINFKILG